jgi:hypothetical protein
MLRTLAVCVALALSLAFTEARAAVYRVPSTGDPAFVVDAPAGWTGAFDRYGNLQFVAPDRSGVVQFTMFGPDPGVATAPLDEIAAESFKAAGAPPYSRSEPGSIVGRPGTTYVGILPEKDFNLDMRVTIVKLGSTHVAAITTLKSPTIRPYQVAAMNALLARVTLTGH